MKETPLTLALSILGFMMTVIWGGPFIRLLHVLKIGKMIRIDGPDTHMLKMGTPTMGGIMFIIPTLLVNAMLNAASLLGVNIMGQTFVLPMITLILYALLGSIDDWEGIRGPRRGLGMRAKTKFLLQIIIAIFLAWIMKHYLNVSYIYWPNYQFPIDLGNWFIPIAVFFIVGMSNAINLTDGLDGLAGLISATAFNVNPAELFMGDCGSLALGATLAVVALLTGHILVLPIIAIIPVSEALSDILQVGYFKYTHGKRLFRMAPLHHHFELLGWSEVQVVQRFWLVSLLFLMLGFAIAML